MKAVDMEVFGAETGDCERAVIASVFDLELCQVPHFRLFPDDRWFAVFYYFCCGIGWDNPGERNFNHDKKVVLERDESVNGFFSACVPSRTYEGRSHGVVIDMQGVVVHDPNPNRRWQGVNVIETKELQSITKFQRADWFKEKFPDEVKDY